MNEYLIITYDYHGGESQTRIKANSDEEALDEYRRITCGCGYEDDTVFRI